MIRVKEMKMLRRSFFSSDGEEMEKSLKGTVDERKSLIKGDFQQAI